MRLRFHVGREIHEPRCHTHMDSTEPRRHNPMANFLRENWLYIVAPLALILVGLTVFIVFFSDGTSSNFIYNIF